MTKMDNLHRQIIIVLLALMALLVVNVGPAFAEPANTYIYISGYSSSTITVLSPVTNQQVADISLPGSPSFIHVNPSGTILAVKYKSIPRIDFLSTFDYSTIGTVNITNGSPFDIAFNSDGTAVYVSVNGTTPTIQKIDMTSYTVTTTYNCANQRPGRITYYNGYVYYVDMTAGTVVKLDSSLNLVGTSGAVISETGGYYIYALLVDQPNNRLIVPNNNGTLIGVDMGTLATNGYFNTGAGSYNIFAADINSSGYVFANDYASPGHIYIFNSAGTLITSYTSPTAGLSSLLLNPYNTTMYLASYNTNTVTVANANTGTVIATGQINVAPWIISMGTQAVAPSMYISVNVNVGGQTFVSGAYVTAYTSSGLLLYTSTTDDAGNSQFAISPGTYTFTVDYNGETESNTITVISGTTAYSITLKNAGSWWNIGSWFSGIINNIAGFFNGMNSSEVHKAGYEDVTKAITTGFSAGSLGGNNGYFACRYYDASNSTVNVVYTLYKYNTSTLTWVQVDTATQTGNSQTQNFTITNAQNGTYYLNATITTQVYGKTYRSWQHQYPATWNMGNGLGNWPLWAIEGFAILVLVGVALAGNSRYELGVATIIIVVLYVLDMLGAMTSLVSHLQVFIVMTLMVIILITYAAARYRRNNQI